MVAELNSAILKMEAVTIEVTVIDSIACTTVTEQGNKMLKHRITGNQKQEEKNKLTLLSLRAL